MKVCLVYPSIRNYGGFNTLGKHPESVYINHGLASIGAVLKEEGHEVSLVDLRECLDWEDTGLKLKQADADWYGIYCSTLDFWEAKKVAELVHHLGKKTIVGGPHPSICPVKTSSYEEFDYVFIGEAEKTLPDLLKEPEDFERLVIGESPDLDSLPIEDRELFNMKKVLATKHPFYPAPFLSIMAGRGCPFRCSFCKPGEDRIFGKFRMRSLDNLIGEIRMLANRYDYKMLMVDDDSFTINPNYIAEFCDSYEKVGRPFTCQTRVDFIVKHPDLVKRLKEIGLWMFVIGFEAGSQRILDLYNKGTTVEQNVEAAKVCHRYGIKIWANVMYGAPSETKEEMLKTVDMVKQIRPYHHSPSIYTPIVGTDLYEYCKTKDLLLSEDPVVLGSRSPNEPKLKGQDHKWIEERLQELRRESLGWLPLGARMKKVYTYVRRSLQSAS